MSDKRIVLHNVTYFDAVHAKMEAGKSIVLADGKIEWVGDSSSFDKGENDQVLNLDGKYVLPGLIDCHVHLEMAETGENPYATYLATPTAYYGYLALKNAQSHLKSGFTTVRDCAGSNWGSSLRRVFSSRLFQGPRILVAQNAVRQFGEQDESLPDDLIMASNLIEQLRLQGTPRPTGVDQMRFAVRERISLGSDFIKVLNTGTVYGIGSKVEKTFFTEEELTALVDEAHRNGLHVACHSHPDRGIQEALNAGVETIEHASYISESTVKRMAKTSTYLVPTHMVDSVRNNPDKMKEYPGFVEKMNRMCESKYERHRIAFERGVKFALGTDSGAVDAPHGTSAKEIEFMISHVGMTPVQALQCATIEAARAIKLGEEIGSIETGKAGDVIVVNSNPVEDVTALQDLANIEYVIKDARVVAERGNLV